MLIDILGLNKSILEKLEEGEEIFEILVDDIVQDYNHVLPVGAHLPGLCSREDDFVEDVLEVDKEFDIEEYRGLVVEHD